MDDSTLAPGLRGRRSQWNCKQNISLLKMNTYKEIQYKNIRSQLNEQGYTGIVNILLPIDK
jgi:hypothetical protein